MKKIIHKQEFVCNVASGVRSSRALRRSKSTSFRRCEDLLAGDNCCGRGRPLSICCVGLVFILLVLLMPGLASGAGTNTKTIFVVGDSIAAGHGVDPEEAFPGLLQHRINDKKLPYEVVNAGVSGDTTAGGVRRMPWLLKRKMDVIILELGGNDGLRGITPKETKANLEKIIDLAREKNPDVQIILAGMQMPQNMGEEYTREYREVFPAVAKEKNVKLIPFLLEGVGGKAELNLPDRIHPNPAGHKIVADTVWVALESILSPQKSPAGRQ